MTKEKIDVNKLGKVAVLMGGQYGEREVSLISGRFALDALVRQGVNAEGIDVGDDIVERLRNGKFDRAFIALHGRGGEDGVIQSLLESMQIPYTGSGVLASALAMDKLRCKWLWQGLGLSIPEFLLLQEPIDWAMVVACLGFPMFVKPNAEGSSLGIAKVNSINELQTAYHAALKYGKDVLVERFIDGPEYTIGILNNETLPIIRIEVANTFYDYEAKYLVDTTQYHIPCGLSPEKEKQLQQIALKAYQSLGCRHWGRVDTMCDSKGNFYLLEVNTIPGLTDHSLVPKAAKSIGIDFDELMLRILVQTV